MLLDLADWVRRVKPVAAGSVDLATDLEAAQENAVNFPAQFICLGQDRVTHANGHPCVRHSPESDVYVMTVIDRGNDAEGDDLIDRLKNAREPIMKSLIGWEPNNQCFPVKWEAGRMFDFKSHAFIWIDVYSVKYTLNLT